MAYKLCSHDIEVLQMLNGEKPWEWGSWVGACIGFLKGAGYVSGDASVGWQITPAGRNALKEAE